MLLVAGLIACGSDGVDIGPTIADLQEQPPLLETADPDPQVTFQVDRQQGIDSFRVLVEVTGDGGVPVTNCDAWPISSWNRASTIS